jgi:hypothetical protein
MLHGGRQEFLSQGDVGFNFETGIAGCLLQSLMKRVMWHHISGCVLEGVFEDVTVALSYLYYTIHP